MARKNTEKGEVEMTSDGPSNKKPRSAYEAAQRPQDRLYPPYPDNRSYVDRRQNYDNNSKLMTKVEQMVDKKLTTATLASAFPPLPATKPPSWNTDDTEDLPEN